MGPCSLLGLLTPASRGPDLSWDSRRAFHRSPPNELDRHVPSRRGLLDHPSQCSQPWPANTISVVTIRRASDHHVTASSMIRPWAHLTHVASLLHLRLRNPVLNWVESSPVASALTPVFAESSPWEIESCYHGSPWQHRSSSVLRLQKLFCSSPSSAWEPTCPSTWVTAHSLPTVDRSVASV